MATKLDWKVAFDEKMLPTMLHNRLITWTCQVTWQMKNVILHFHEICATKLDRMVAYDKEPQT